MPDNWRTKVLTYECHTFLNLSPPFSDCSNFNDVMMMSLTLFLEPIRLLSQNSSLLNSQIKSNSSCCVLCKLSAEHLLKKFRVELLENFVTKPFCRQPAGAPACLLAVHRKVLWQNFPKVPLGIFSSKLWRPPTSKPRCFNPLAPTKYLKYLKMLQMCQEFSDISKNLMHVEKRLNGSGYWACRKFG